MLARSGRPGHLTLELFRKPFILLLLVGVSCVGGEVNVLTPHNDNARTGLSETLLTPSNVNVKQFGLLAKRVVDDQVYGQPLYVSAGSTHDVGYLTTVNNSVYAFDAIEPGASQPYWHVNFALPASLSDGEFGCTDINGNMGIFDALKQNQRPALLLSGDVVYVGYASHCGRKPYHGYLIGYDAKSLKETGVFNTSPTRSGASIWQSGQGPAVDANATSHLHSLAYWNSAKNGPLVYVWGQKDQLRVYSLSGGKYETTPFAIRPEANDGHPGAMVSISANGNKNGILWAAIHKSGDSWHESRPGVLHAYDAVDATRGKPRPSHL